VYVGFVVDAYARRIVGWRCGSSMTTQLVLDALRAGRLDPPAGRPAPWFGGGTYRSGVAQYTSLRYTERLEQAGIAASVGSAGSSYDNALAESINGLYKTELI